MTEKKPMTITEKILSKSFGKNEVEPGEIGLAQIDLLMIHEMSASRLIPLFEELRKVGATVWDSSKVVMCWDHLLAPASIAEAELHKKVAEFCRNYNIVYYDLGRGGVGHQLFHEKGYVVPGETICGADSHNVTHGAFGCVAVGIGVTEATDVLVTGELWMRVPKSIKIIVRGKLGDMVVGKDVFLYVAGQLGVDSALYKAIEWAGSAVEEMGLSGRLTLTNMSVEMGAKNGIIEPGEETLKYVRARTRKPFEVVKSDTGARYDAIYEFDITELEPQVAVPYSPANGKPVSEVTGIKLDQVFIGSCTNGRIEDLRMAATILKGKKVHPNVRLLVIPASQEIYALAAKEGLISIFLDADASIFNPSCGPCGGAWCGTLGANEVGLYTNNRNFVGRGGDPSSKLYIANAAVAAASAIAGEIIDPRKFTIG